MVTDMLGRQVEIGYDEDLRTGWVSVEKDGGTVRIPLARESFQSIVRVVVGWPISPYAAGGASDH